MPEIIIVAIFPNDRSYEYLHVKEFTPDGSHVGGGLPEYAAYVARIKTFIDARYRTIPDGKATTILGSSHGGLAAFYTACVFGNLFGNGVAMSPSFWAGGVFDLNDSYLMMLVDPHLRGRSNRPRLWIDYGLRRGLPLPWNIHDFCFERWATIKSQEMVRILQRDYGYILGKDLFEHVDPIGGHDELAWRYRFGLVVKQFYGRRV